MTPQRAGVFMRRSVEQTMEGNEHETDVCYFMYDCLVYLGGVRA